MLVTNIPVAKATEPPPITPSATGLVDKGAVSVDWKHTSSSWLNRNTKMCLFRETAEGAYQNREVKTKELAACTDGEGYVMKTT